MLLSVIQLVSGAVECLIMTKEALCCLLGPPVPPAPVSVSLRLERMELTDVEAAMVTEWCREHVALVSVRKLWLFDNRIGDAGAAALASLMTADMLEVT